MKGDPWLLGARDLSLGYEGRAVLAGVDFAIGRGERWSILGPNGAGKSTLMAALAGLLAPMAGTLDRAGDAARPARLGYVPQRCEFNRHLPTTVREFVTLGLVGLGISVAEGRARLPEALGAMGLGGLERRNYWSLSGGQRQRVLIARALVRRPAVLLLDEPAAGLDAGAEAALLAVLDALHAAGDFTSVLITHDLAAALRTSTHLALVRDGAVHAAPASDAALHEEVERCYGLRLWESAEGMA